MRYVDRTILLFLSAIFLFSSIDKILHYEGFVNALRSYILVPQGMAPYLSVPVIAVELLIGIGLLVRPWRRPAAMTAIVTLALFTAAVATNSLYGERGICGCWFTITLARTSRMHLLQNLLFLGLALSIWWDERSRGRAAEPPGSAAPADPPVVLSAIPEYPPRPGGGS